MNLRTLGRSGLRIPPLCFGTMTFGREADRATSAALFHRCREAGINLFDCADLYAQGESERILGGLIAGCRDEVLITSKAYYALEKTLRPIGLSRAHLLSAVDASLARLKTDRIDLYFVHHFDEHTPLEETLGALADIVRAGKVRFLGASNFAAWQIEKALGISALKGWPRFECIQPMYNLVKRQAEVEILPMAQAEQLGVITYSPLGGGLLTGKFTSGFTSAPGRLSTDATYQHRYAGDQNLRTAQAFCRLARDHGLDPVTLAIAWVARHPAVTAPIIGARNLQQLDPALKAMDLRVGDDLYAAVCALMPQPPPATDRTEEFGG